MAYQQSSLDSMCSIYAICNAVTIVKGYGDDEVQELFNSIITYLSKKRKLKDIIIGGAKHKDMKDIMRNVVSDIIPNQITDLKWSEYTLKDWWNWSSYFLQTPNTSIILCTSGREDHYSTIERMTTKEMILKDSAGIKKIRYSSCKLPGYQKSDKYIILPSQCWYLKEL